METILLVVVIILAVAAVIMSWGFGTKETRRAACAMLLAVFIADIAYSGSHPNTGEGITVAAAVEKTVASS